jgi:hypothetical protein
MEGKKPQTKAKEMGKMNRHRVEKIEKKYKKKGKDEEASETTKLDLFGSDSPEREIFLGIPREFNDKNIEHTGALGLITTLGATRPPCLVGVPGPLPGERLFIPCCCINEVPPAPNDPEEP